MTTFRFIHTADWQIGTQFGAFPSDLAAVLRDARTNVISRIGNLASDKSVGHVVVAGDVWDSEQPSPQMIRQPLDLMGGVKDVTWWMLPGNHDPVRNNMLWDRVAEFAPDNVRLMLVPEPIEAEAGVWLLPAPWNSKNPGRDLTEWMDEASTPKGEIRIGIGHGSVRDFSSPHGTSESGNKSVINPDRAGQARLDYLALGDWHGTMEINSKTWYSGTPEPDRFPRNNPGNVLLVEATSGSDPVVEILTTAQFTWQTSEIPCFSGDQSYPDIDGWENLGTLRQTLLQVSLSGELSFDEWTALDLRLNSLGERCAFMQRRDGELIKLVSDDNLDQLDQSGSVRVAAERLLARRDDPSLAQVDRDLAGDALVLLLSFASEEKIL